MLFVFILHGRLNLNVNTQFKLFLFLLLNSNFLLSRLLRSLLISFLFFVFVCISNWRIIIFFMVWNQDLRVWNLSLTLDLITWRWHEAKFQLRILAAYSTVFKSFRGDVVHFEVHVFEIHLVLPHIIFHIRVFRFLVCAVSKSSVEL